MSVLDLTLYETLPLPDEGRGGRPILRTKPCRRTVRVRRDLSARAGSRRWLLELELSVRMPDPEQTLAECQGFLVDAVDGREIGVVDEVEAAGPEGLVSALVVVSGWFGRRRVRIPAEQIEVVVPAERRLIVREPSLGFEDADPRRA